jgi:hypothetical protein
MLKQRQFCQFSEPDITRGQALSNVPNVRDTSEMKNFQNVVLNTTKPFLAKIHLAHLKTRYVSEVVDYLLESEDVFRIGLTRYDIIAQIKSFYIATLRLKHTKWHYAKTDEINPGIIPIHIGRIKYIIDRTIRYHYAAFNTQDVKFNVKLTYEQIMPLLCHDSVPFIKSPRHINDQEIEDLIRDLIRDFYTSYISNTKQN